MFVDVLPWWERCTYWVVAVSGLAYAVYIMFLEGEMYKKSLINATILPGWTWLARDQDASDTEWYIFRKFLKQTLVLNGLHVLLSQICFYLKVSMKVHSCTLLICDLAAVYIIFNERVVIFLVFTALVMYAVSYLGRKSFVWMLKIALLFTLNYEYIYDIQIRYLQLEHYEQEYRFHIISAFFYIRLVSFAMEKIKYLKTNGTQRVAQTQTFQDSNCSSAKEKFTSFNTAYKDDVKKVTDSSKHLKTCVNYSDSPGVNDTIPPAVDFDPSLLNLLFYSFYLPTLTVGPIYIYSDFYKNVNSSFRSINFIPDVKDIIKQLVRIALWALFIEFQFHFLYYSALSLHPFMMKRLPIWAVVAIGYCGSQYFMVKYFVMYGMAVQLSRFDGLSPIARPRCISWTYSLTDLWKYFDVGLYNFIKTYIYIPLGGSKAGLPRKLFASGVAFLFIFYWHGARKAIFIWCFGNYIMCIVEEALPLLKHSFIGIKLISFMGPAMRLRCKAIIIFPVFIASFLQIMFFLYRGEVGMIFVSRLLTRASWTNLLAVFIFFTAGIHNALYITQRYEHKQKGIHKDNSDTS